MPKPLTPHDLARLPLPGTAFPSSLAFSHDERALSYLYSPEGSLRRRLFVMVLDDEVRGGEPATPFEVELEGVATSEADLSPEERLRRERTRDVGLGVSSALWAEGADVLLVPLQGGLHVVSGLSTGPRAARNVLAVPADTLPGAIVGSRLSPDGATIAFVSGGELHVASADGCGLPARLTSTAQDGVSNGIAEYVAQEEMGRAEGLWWSSDSRLIAYAQVDERHVPAFRIVHYGSDAAGEQAEEVHRYPFAGAANAVVRLGVVPACGGATAWMDTGNPDQYLARVHWLEDGRLVAELQSRDQSRLDVVAFDPATGSGTLLHRETGDPYVNLHGDFRALPDGAYLWSSERTGYRHLEVRSLSGGLVAQLTSGDWQVDGVEAIDKAGGLAYFSARKDGPAERHLYCVPLAGGEIRRLTPERGTHACVVGPRAGVFADRHCALDSPPAVRVRSLADGSVVAVLHDRRDPLIDELALEPPELVSFAADDGTPLLGLVYRPEGPATDPPPMVVSVYGGPHAQRAVDDWAPTVSMRAQAFRRLGFTVLAVDNRGSAGRGLAFERPIWHKMGDIEVADQVRGVRWAVEQGLADPGRVGIYGWSYGGYMSLRCLGIAPGTFRAGVAGAPVTHWDGYDTHYTERYMGTPESNAEGYESSSALGAVATMRGALLLVHGLIDENVHFRHTARLIDRLIAERKPYDLLLFPDERHLPRREEDRAYMEEHVVAWMVRALAADAPTDR